MDNNISENNSFISASNNMSHKCLVSFQFIYRNLKTAERKAADYCLKYPELVATQTITETANKADCSEATLVRLSRHLGYDGFPELKGNILASGFEDVTHYVNTASTDTIESTATSIFNLCILYLQDSLQAINIDSLKEAARLIEKANRILFIAAGDAHFIAASGAQKFLRLGYMTSSASDFDTQLLWLSQMKENDLVFCISHSGKSKSVYDIAKIAHDANIKVVSISNFPSSQLSKVSDLVLLTASFAYDLMDEVIAKRVPALCILDVLYIYILSKKEGCYKNDFPEINEFLSHNKF